MQIFIASSSPILPFYPPLERGQCGDSHNVAECNCFSTNKETSCGKCDKDHSLSPYVPHTNESLSGDHLHWKDIHIWYKCEYVGYEGCDIAIKDNHTMKCVECDYDNYFRMNKFNICVKQMAQ